MSDILPGDPSPKDSVWALYARSQLLFTTAVHVKYTDRLTEQTKAEFAVRAWLETERIEAQLDLHTCDVEKSTSERFPFVPFLLVLAQGMLLNGVTWQFTTVASTYSTLKIWCHRNLPRTYHIHTCA